MGEIGTNPLRARPLSFSSFHNLFLPSHIPFSKPLSNNTKKTFRNVGAFEPIRFPKRNPSGVRILSKCASDSSSSSSEFVLLSATGAPQVSLVFVQLQFSIFCFILLLFFFFYSFLFSFGTFRENNWWEFDILNFFLVMERSTFCWKFGKTM